MSTYQPPGGGQQPDGTPGYAPPQDPWEGGYEPGLASVPTDPIPQQQQQPYGVGYAPGYQQGEIWSQPTAGGYPGYEPPNRTGKIILVTLLVVLLAGGGGFLAWYLIKNRPGGGGGTDDPTASASGTATPTATATATPDNTPPVAFDPFQVKVGDCLVNDNPDVPNDPKMRIVPCDQNPNFEVLTIVSGADIPQDDDGQISESESQEACKETGYTNYYQSNSDGVERDVVFCMKAV
jgi:hypothetical protein